MEEFVLIMRHPDGKELASPEQIQMDKLPESDSLSS
jgi:hypothetical protein